MNEMHETHASRFMSTLISTFILWGGSSGSASQQIYGSHQRGSRTMRQGFSRRGSNGSQRQGFRMLLAWLIKDLKLKGLWRPSTGEEIEFLGRLQGLNQWRIRSLKLQWRQSLFSWNFFQNTMISLMFNNDNWANSIRWWQSCDMIKSSREDTKWTLRWDCFVICCFPG